jgi:hypothetical protein
VAKKNRNVRPDAQRGNAARRRREQQRRQRMIRLGSAVGLVLVLVAVLVIVRVVGGAGTPSASGSPSGLAPTSVVQAVTTVPGSVLDTIGIGSVSNPPAAIAAGQPALTSNGKPLVVYLGAEYCPFCAAQRWAVVVALSRFGTFTGLGTTHSASADVYPDTATLSFHGATYTSAYLEFQGVEMQSNQRSGNTYAVLDAPTAAQQQIMQRYNAPPFVSADAAGAIPFIDFGNRYLVSGASYSPQLLAGLSGDQIAGALKDPASPVAKAVDGSANAITAVLCKLTGGQPGQVCTGPAVTAFQDKL